jgi:hypothetical protein
VETFPYLTILCLCVDSVSLCMPFLTAQQVRQVFREVLGWEVHPNTLRMWSRTGKLRSVISPGGKRTFYPIEEVAGFRAGALSGGGNRTKRKRRAAMRGAPPQPQDKGNEFLEAALRYAEELKWKVLPLLPKGKRPHPVLDRMGYMMPQATPK